MSMSMLSELNNNAKSHEDRIFSILFQEDELTWQTIIYDLVKSEEMDPWDINVTQIAERFIGMLRKITDMDFRISGKMVLAASLLLKIKSDRLMKEDIVALDNLLSSAEDQGEFLEELQDFAGLFAKKRPNAPRLVARTPQPRQRKVSVYDLVEALELALEVETRRNIRKIPGAPEVKVPEKKQDMTKLIGDMYQKVRKTLSSTKVIAFDQLIPSPSREDKVYTFIPLLHLDTQRKIDLLQKEHFGLIQVKLNKYAMQSS